MGQGQRTGSREGCLAVLWPLERDSSLTGVAQRTDSQCLCPLTPMAGHVHSSERGGNKCTQSIESSPPPAQGRAGGRGAGLPRPRQQWPHLHGQQIKLKKPEQTKRDTGHPPGPASQDGLRGPF